MNLHTLSSLLLSFALFGATAAVAQQTDPQAPAAVQQQTPAPVVRHHRGHSPERETRELTRKLNLTPDQASQVEPILAAKREQMRALKSSGTTDPAAFQQQKREIAKDTRQKLAAVLTPDQREQFKAMRAAHHHQKMEGAGAAPAPTV